VQKVSPANGPDFPLGEKSGHRQLGPNLGNAGRVVVWSVKQSRPAPVARE